MSPRLIPAFVYDPMRHISAGRAALMLGWSRDRVVRAIQDHRIAGGCFEGRWYADQAAVQQTANRADEPAGVVA